MPSKRPNSKGPCSINSGNGKGRKEVSNQKTPKTSLGLCHSSHREPPHNCAYNQQWGQATLHSPSTSLQPLLPMKSWKNSQTQATSTYLSPTQVKHPSSYLSTLALTIKISTVKLKGQKTKRKIIHLKNAYLSSGQSLSIILMSCTSGEIVPHHRHFIMGITGNLST